MWRGNLQSVHLAEVVPVPGDDDLPGDDLTRHPHGHPPRSLRLVPMVAFGRLPEKIGW